MKKPIMGVTVGTPIKPDKYAGKSAYDIARKYGYKGTEEEWIKSIPGKSAYDYAVELGYEGTEEEYKAACEAQRVLSIVQTVKSEVSGGDNIWEATFGSGKTERLVVRNGVRGPKGASSFSAEIKDGVLVVDEDVAGENGDDGDLSLQDNGGLVINEGEANGSYSIAGGTTDKTLVENIAGVTTAALVDANAAVANGEMSISYGVDTIAETAGSAAVGIANFAGAKGYYWHSINLSNKTITLSTTRKAKTNSSATAPTNIDWAVGDYISIRNKDRGYGYCSKITKVSGNVITVDSLPFDADLYSAVLGYISYEAPYDRTIYAVYQENYLGQSKVKRWKCRGGTVDLGFGAVANGMQNGATGIFSEVSGRGNLAAGDYARAEGRATVASGEGSHAEGQRTIARGYAAHAEGTADASANEFVLASGDAAHAEGYAGQATGNYSHAEGHKSTASGGASHAEGDQTRATEWSAHAEGQETEATDLYTHAEGLKTHATKVAAHAEGARTTASGGAAHAEGADTIASGERAHAEGEQTHAIGWSAHAEGNRTLAEGLYSHAEGLETDAIGASSHAEGYRTEAVGDSSHAEGSNSMAEGAYSHAEGEATIASGSSSHAEGIGTKASGKASHVEGEGTKASGTYAHAEGYGTIANGRYSHAAGVGTTVPSGNSNGCTIVGRYGTAHNDSLFAVAGGTSSSDKKLVFEVTADGGFVINSSTPGSTARFRVTVDDDGVLKATKI